MQVNNGVDSSTRTGNMMFEESVDMEFSEKNIANLAFLLTNLYNDPELAVIREYIANGIDAHTAAGVDKPVIVYAPTESVPEFRVVDEGTGMSKDTVLNVYSKYGESTKSSSNDEIGGFGLGCKAGLAIASQFTVNTVKDGWNTLAIVQRTDAGSPKMNIVSHAETDSSDGTTISIPVSPTSNFYSKLDTFLYFTDSSLVKMEEGYYYNRHFTDSPSLTDKFESSDGTSSIRFITSPGYQDKADRGVVYVIMGGIYYAVPASQIYSNLSDENKKYGALFDSFATIIDAGIGELSLTPNRESLRFDDKTIGFFNNIIQDVFDKVISRDEEAISGAENYLSAREMYYKSASYTLGSTCAWNGIDLSDELLVVFSKYIASPRYYADSDRMVYEDYINKNDTNESYIRAHTLQINDADNLVMGCDIRKYKSNAKAYIKSLNNSPVRYGNTGVKFFADSLDDGILVVTKKTYRKYNSIKDFKGDASSRVFSPEEYEKFIGHKLNVVSQEEYQRIASEYRTKNNEPKAKRHRKTESNYNYKVIFKEEDDSVIYSTYRGDYLQDLIEDKAFKSIKIISGEGNDSDAGREYLSSFVRACTPKSALLKVIGADCLIIDNSLRLKDTLQNIFKSAEIIKPLDVYSKMDKHVASKASSASLRAMRSLSALGGATISSHPVLNVVKYAYDNGINIKDPLLRDIQKSYKYIEENSDYVNLVDFFYSYNNVPSLAIKSKIGSKEFMFDVGDASNFYYSNRDYFSDDIPLTIKVLNTVYTHNKEKENK